MNDKVQGLIDVLLDKTARIDERDDAAMDLGSYNDIGAIEALTKIASDPNENDMIVDSAAESIGKIYVSRNYFNEDLFRRMIPFAQEIVFYYIMTNKPTLFTQSFREEFKKYDTPKKKMKDRVQLLIDILFDKTAREDERDDAAMYLGDYKDIRALEALTKIVSNPDEDKIIIESAAESIGEICIGMNYFNEDQFRKMVPFAQNIVFGAILILKPVLIKQSLREEFKQYDDSQKKMGALMKTVLNGFKEKNERSTTVTYRYLVR